MSIKISTSILSADFSNLSKVIKDLEQAGTDYIHLDVMDGQFVPNISFGHYVVESIRKITKLPLDVHLMIQNPSMHIENFARAGADMITIHPESEIHIHRSLNLIKSLGKKAGIALNPSINENILNYLIDVIDLVLIMTVNPGFSGQKFIESQLQKIQNVKKFIENRNISISVDGGIDHQTSSLAIASGADILISGSYVVSKKTIEEKKSAIEKLRIKL